MNLTGPDFQYICDFVYKKSGIVLEKGKEYLVESRLVPLARDEGLKDIADLVGKMRLSSSNGLCEKVVEAMTTNETSFFRDRHPFDALKAEVLPKLIQGRKAARALNIWCMACSTGQEPYTISMVIKEHFSEISTWKVVIQATDLSQEVLAKAKEGKYRQLEVNRGLPAPMLLKYFAKQGLEWQLKDEIRKMVTFGPINLTDNWPTFPKRDVIFLRNVMIYFDVETKRKILARVRQALAPDGYLFLGGAETVTNLDDSYERVTIACSGCYRVRQ